MATETTLKKDIKNLISKLIKTEGTSTAMGIAEILAQIGVGLGVKAAINAALGRIPKTEGQLKSDVENFVITSLENYELTQMDLKKDFRNALNDYYLNFYNKWFVNFGSNKALGTTEIEITKNLELFNVFCSEVSIPGEEISLSKNPLVFTENEDISDLSYGDLTMSFYCDGDMWLRKFIHLITNTMRNRNTGRYGYRTNYQFDYIDVAILNNVQDQVLVYSYQNCIIKNIGEINLEMGTSDVKNITLTFGYDSYEIIDSIDINTLF